MKLTVALQMDIRSRLLGAKLGRKLNLLILMREREDMLDYRGRRVVVRDERGSSAARAAYKKAATSQGSSNLFPRSSEHRPKVCIIRELAIYRRALLSTAGHQKLAPGGTASEDGIVRYNSLGLHRCWLVSLV